MQDDYNEKSPYQQKYGRASPEQWRQRRSRLCRWSCLLYTSIRDALLEKLLARNEELQDKILELTCENATLKTKMEFLASEGGQARVPGTTRAPGEDTAE